MKKGMSRLELFTSGERISPFIINELADRVRTPIIFLTPAGGKAYGYDAEVLVELCEAVLAARADGVLQKQQLPIAQQCEVIMRGLARVGIVARAILENPLPISDLLFKAFTAAPGSARHARPE